jgi:hypothetical protein
MAKVKLKKGEKEQVISFSQLFKSLPVNLQKGMKAKMRGMDPEEKVDAVLRAVKSGMFEGYRPVPKSRPDSEQRRRAGANVKTISLMAKGGKATSKKMMRGGKVAAKKKMAYGGKAMAKKKK